MIFQYVEEKYFDKISRCITAKDPWHLLERNYRGTEKSVDDYYNQVMVIVNPLKSNVKCILEAMKKIIVVINPLKSNGKNILKVMKKIMRSFPSKFEHIVCII